MGTRREEIQASIDLAYRLAKDLGDEVGVLADVEYGEPIARAALELADALRALTFYAKGWDPAKRKALDLLARLDIPRPDPKP
jgi:hypothetical protein